MNLKAKLICPMCSSKYLPHTNQVLHFVMFYFEISITSVCDPQSCADNWLTKWHQINKIYCAFFISVTDHFYIAVQDAKYKHGKPHRQTLFSRHVEKWICNYPVAADVAAVLPSNEMWGCLRGLTWFMWNVVIFWPVFDIVVASSSMFFSNLHFNVTCDSEYPCGSQCEVQGPLWVLRRI